MSDTYYTLGLALPDNDGDCAELPETDINSETAYGAIRLYKQQYPEAGWISANNLAGDRQEWHAGDW